MICAAMVSFIVPAYNEEACLGATLQAIQRASATLSEPSEIIVVDDDSTDSTADVALRHGARLIRVKNRQIAATRNAGARAAQGDLFIFVDADTLVSEAVVVAACGALRNRAVGGGCRFCFDGKVPFYGRVLTALAVPLYRVLKIASGSFVFCTRKAFEAVGGFDEELFAAEELAFSRALRKQGPFVVLRESVMTSGRKLRSYSAREVFAPLIRLALTRGRSVKKRAGLDLWYGPRRADLDSAP